MESELQKTILGYIEHFLKNDRCSAIWHCMQWNGSNGRWFGAKLPEDFIMELLAGFIKGKICYTKSYKHFLGSVYFHLNFAMKSYFKYREGERCENCEVTFSEADAEKYIERGGYAEGAEVIFSGIENNELRERIISLFDPQKEVEELFVLDEIFKGGKREEIAKELGISPDYCTNIFKRISNKVKKRLNTKILEDI